MECQLFILLALTVVGSWAAPGIIHGGSAVPGQFPYQAAIFIQNKFACSGAIVDTKKIVTVAHCVVQPNTNKSVDLTDIQILVNDLSISSKNRWNVSKIVIHPQYDWDTHVADLAVLIIADSLYGSTDASIKVYNNKTMPDVAVISGWGSVTTESTDPNDKLQYATLDYISSTDCAKALGDDSQAYINNNTICYQNDGTTETDACDGDEGDPIVSYGQLIGLEVLPGACKTSLPSVFQEVSSYSDWISSTNGAVGSQLGLSAIIFLIFSIVRLN